MYEKILARSFSRYEQKKLRYAALMAFLLTVLSFCTVFNSYTDRIPLCKFRFLFHFHPIENSTMLSEAVDHLKHDTSLVKSEISCDFLLPLSNTCTVTGDVRVDGMSGTISVPEFKPDLSRGNSTKSWKLKPYARKYDPSAMRLVREWSVKSVWNHHKIPNCSVNHSVPAIIFSNRGYSGNHFHDFTDTLIPLFLSAKRLDGEVKFLVTNYRNFWRTKYRKILNKLSKYEIIDIDNEQNIHCFPELILGLTSQKEFDVDPSMPPHNSLTDFTSFIRDAYSLPRSNAINLTTQNPRLMIISRKSTRRLINIRNVIKMAENLKYQVIVAEGNSAANLSEFAESINSCDVLLGVHGAGLTNMVFLPENAVIIQIVPLGLESISSKDFEYPAQDMKLKYLDYNVTKEESSLMQQYPADHVVFRDPDSVLRQNWHSFRAIYLDKQDVTVDVGRLKALLVKAMQLLHQ